MSAPPGERGYRLPAEWEPHEATWLSWPHKASTWPGKFARIEPVMAQAVAALAGSEPVRVNVQDAAHGEHVRALLAAAGVDPGKLHLHALPTDDAWCRDHGAIFVTRDGEAPLAAVDCGFNAWGGKYPPWDRDAAVAGRMAGILGIPCHRADMVLEGGAIDGNGAGTLLVTEQCLLNPNRNPSLDRAGIEARLAALFGAVQILWLGEGIAGDDTDGHVDDIARFVARDRVVAAVEPDRGDPNHGPLAENLRRLRAARLPDGSPLDVIELPMPAPRYWRGERLPASYANFYVANRIVLLPVYACDQDRQAADILAACFPARRIVPIDCRDLVVGLGAFHCLTQQVPAHHSRQQVPAHHSRRQVPAPCPSETAQVHRSHRQVPRPPTEGERENE